MSKKNKVVAIQVGSAPEDGMVLIGLEGANGKVQVLRLLPESARRIAAAVTVAAALAERTVVVPDEAPADTGSGWYGGEPFDPEHTATVAL